MSPNEEGPKAFEQVIRLAQPIPAGQVSIASHLGHMFDELRERRKADFMENGVYQSFWFEGVEYQVEIVVKKDPAHPEVFHPNVYQ